MTKSHTSGPTSDKAGAPLTPAEQSARDKAINAEKSGASAEIASKQQTDGYTADAMSQSDEGGPATSAIDENSSAGKGPAVAAVKRETGALEDEASRKTPAADPKDKGITFGDFALDDDLSDLEKADEASQRVAKNPGGRVTLQAMKNDVVGMYFVTGAQLADVAAALPGDQTLGYGIQDGINQQALKSLQVLTLCVVIVTNGYSFVGKSAPADPLNYDPDYGKKLAYDDVIRQMWPVYGFAKRMELAAR